MPVTHFAVLFREPHGQAGGTVVRADRAVLDGALHQLFEEDRLVYQIPAARALRVEGFAHHRAAEEFLRTHREPLQTGGGGSGALHLEELGPSRTTNRSSLVESRHMQIAERILPAKR